MEQFGCQIFTDLLCVQFYGDNSIRPNDYGPELISFYKKNSFFLEFNLMHEVNN